MNKQPKSGKNFVIFAAFCAVILFILAQSLLYAAAAPAGTEISNQATATYTDAGGTLRSVTSNIVTTVVQQVASLTLTADNTRYSTAGGQVNMPHILTNTGNGSDNFNLSIVQSGGDNFDLSNLLIYPDANGDGIPDSGAPSITSTGNLATGAIFQFVVVGNIPVSATGDAVITITATSVFNGAQTASNTDTATVNLNAVVNITKAISAPSGAPGSGPYTYTLTYTNTGNGPASDISISDLIPAGMTYVPGSARWSVSGATPLSDGTGGDPAGISYDYNITTSAATTAVIANVPSGVSGNCSFQVNVNSGLPVEIINNIATYSYNDGNQVLSNNSTNTVPFSVTAFAAVTFTGETIPLATQGATVSFTNIATNTGNSTDTFDITVGTSTFPAGTTFVLYQTGGLNLLLDSNNNGTPDTGPLAPGASYNVVIKATLPSAYFGNVNYTVHKIATSAYNPTVSATATDTLTAITQSTVDLTNNLSIANGAGSAQGLGVGPEATPVTTITVNPAAQVVFDLYVNNTSGVSDSYVLQASTDSTFATLVLPAGCSAVFKDAGGTIISNTGPIIAGGNAHVYGNIITPNTMPPGNYQIYFRVLSLTTGASDIKHDLMAINEVRNMALIPNNTGQVFPGGSVVYTHTITNNGNVIEGDGVASLVALTLSDSQSGFTSVIYWDKNNNGILDASDVVISSLSALTGGTNGASTTPGLDPGESATLFVKVFAPAGAISGQIDVATFTATPSQGTYTTPAPTPFFITDTSTVLSSNITIVKEQALDANGDGTPDTPYSSVTISTGAVPGACIRYRITLTNAGTASANAVVVTDTTPAYTVYDDGDGTTSPTGIACMTTNAGVSYTAVTAPVDGAPGSIIANVGSLSPGQSAVVYLGIKLNH